jgi:hypothetical protein
MGAGKELEDRVVEERFHTWTVSWRRDEFSIRTPQGRTAGSFNFRRPRSRN